MTDNIDVYDTNEIVTKYFNSRNPAIDHIDSFNRLYEGEMNEIFSQMKSERRLFFDKDSDIAELVIQPRFSNVKILPPVARVKGVDRPMFPGFAQRNGKIYTAPLKCDFKVTVNITLRNGEEVVLSDEVLDTHITDTMLMKKTFICPSSKLVPEAETRLNEDAMDIGGYFILINNNKLIMPMETSPYWLLRTYNNNHGNELSRAESISKEDNDNGISASLILTLRTNGQIICKIDHVPFEEIDFPFFVLLRLLGMKNHKEIFNALVWENNTTIGKAIEQIVENAFNAEYKQLNQCLTMSRLEDVKDAVIAVYNKQALEKLNPGVYENNKAHYFDRMYDALDKYLYPHIGNKDNFRMDKAYKLCKDIREMLLCHLCVLTETDRDSEVYKRNETSGKRMIKMLKTYISSTLMTPIINAYEASFRSTDYRSINLGNIYKNSLNKGKLLDIQTRTITSGAKTNIRAGVGKSSGVIVNKLKTQACPDNYLNKVATLTQIISNPTTASSKQSAREHMLRQVHETSYGAKCPVQTQESENIGLTKQKAITSHTLVESPVSVLVTMLEKECGKYLRKYRRNEAREEIAMNCLIEVVINNGYIDEYWTSEPNKLVDTFIAARREGKINRFVSVDWDFLRGRISFNCDSGRMAAPKIIVFNNGKTGADFRQWSAIRKRHIDDLVANKSTVEDFIKMGLMEYLELGEQNEMFIAQSPAQLDTDEKNYLKKYTHVEMPASLYGLPALMGINSNFNQGTRATYATNHIRQAACEFTTCWRTKKIKNLGIQFCNTLPPVQTIANKIVVPPGNVVRVAILTRRYNQEDSQEFNDALIDSGKYTLEVLNTISSNLENSEEFALPPIGSKGIKKNINYSSINSATGMPDVGRVLHKNDVAIAKVLKIIIDRKTEKVEYQDKSVIYNLDEPAVVLSAREYRNQYDILIHELNIAKHRLPGVGDKFASRGGNKGVMGAHFSPLMMPFDEFGGRPDIIINPHCMPTRMITSQMTESILSIINGLNCVSTDSSIHTPMNVRKIISTLKEMGLNEHGCVQLYDPTTGQKMSTLTFCGPIFYSNLQKFVEEKRSAVGSFGRTNAITHQPASGIKNGGSLKIGEMEKDALIAIGCSMFVMEKMYFHSNPYTIYVCENCGQMPVVDKRRGILKCPKCVHDSRTYAVDTTRSGLVFIQSLQALGYSVNIGLN